MDLSSDSVIVATARHVSADMGEEIILLHLENGLYFGLGNVGTRIWQLLEKPVTVREIERVLLEEYDVEPERCHAEVLRLVSDLVDQQLVEVQEV
jgi:hypothetical protein